MSKVTQAMRPRNFLILRFGVYFCKGYRGRNCYQYLGIPCPFVLSATKSNFGNEHFFVLSLMMQVWLGAGKKVKVNAPLPQSHHALQPPLGAVISI